MPERNDDVVIHDHSVVLHDLLEAGEAVYAELEGQAAHERLQNARAELHKALVAAKAALEPVRAEVVALKDAVAAKRAEDAAAAAQQRHDDHNAQLDNKSSGGPAQPAPSSPQPADPAPTSGTVQ
jgi:peptidoglycan hydrolase CwlO-like protein